MRLFNLSQIDSFFSSFLVSRYHIYFFLIWSFHIQKTEKNEPNKSLKCSKLSNEGCQDVYSLCKCSNIKNILFTKILLCWNYTIPFIITQNNIHFLTIVLRKHVDHYLMLMQVIRNELNDKKCHIKKSWNSMAIILKLICNFDEIFSIWSSCLM